MDKNIKENKVNNENEAVEKKSKINVYKILTFILTPVILTGLMILILNYTTNIWFYLRPKVIIFVVILLEVLHVFLTAVTGSSKRSTIIQSILLWILELLNILRYTYTYEPIKFSDFVYSSNAGEIFSLVGRKYRRSTLEMDTNILLFSCNVKLFNFYCT